MTERKCSSQGSHSVEEISELRPEQQEAAKQGKNKGRNLGRENDKCKGPEAGRNSKKVIVAGPDEKEEGHRGEQDSGHKGSHWPGAKHLDFILILIRVFVGGGSQIPQEG